MAEAKLNRDQKLLWFRSSFTTKKQRVNENNETININAQLGPNLMYHNKRNVMNLYLSGYPEAPPAKNTAAKHKKMSENLFQLTRNNESNSGNEIKYFILLRTNCQ